MTLTRRIRVDFQYLGANYAGWQWQDNALSIQQVAEEALSKIVNHTVRFTASGRTDAGVHAIRQPAHVEVETRMDDNSIMRAMNALLPPDIAVTSVETVPGGWHARFSAKEKTYRYDILNTKVRSVFLHGRAWLVHSPLDIEAMRRGAECLVGEHDFSSFRSSGCSAKSPVRTVFKVQLTRDSDLISFTVTANGFLKQMVRNIVGTLVEAGRGKISPERVKQMLEARDRTAAGPCAPPEGLYLVDVVY
ncbi:MAG: tRNA pseudouridine(38-40) synthase TruA [Nitrospinae bacterium]|nr:tRNA pseudouridine(38-40) synthase TruA [Nitrospinota bacterium]